MHDFPKKLQNVVLSSGETKVCLNRETVTAFEHNQRADVTSGFLWRASSADEMQRDCSAQQVPTEFRDVTKLWKSLEHVALYCHAFPDSMMELTAEQVNILLALAVEKRSEFCLSISMRTAVACNVGDLVVAFDPSLFDQMTEADRVRYTLEFKGTPAKASAIYFVLLSVDTMEAPPLPIIAVPNVTLGDLGKNHLSGRHRRVILCAADWLWPANEPQHGNHAVREEQRGLLDVDWNVGVTGPAAANGRVSAFNPEERCDEATAMLESNGLRIGSTVILTHLDFNAIIMWYGFVPNHENLVVGVDSNAPQTPGYGVLDPKEVQQYYPSAQQDLTYTYLGLLEPVPDKSGSGGSHGQRQQPHGQQYGNASCETIPGLVPPPSGTDSRLQLVGRNRGIQGHHNSCYLDSTLFAMFATVDAFDGALMRPADVKQDIGQFEEIQRCLREGIVNCLRQNRFVRDDRVLTLRQHLDKLNVIPGMMSDEKDPEEFINLLLDHALRHEPFIRLSTGQSCHVLQLFLDRSNLPFEDGKEQSEREAGRVADTETLLHLSLIQSNIQLSSPPKCLILQMPRSGKSFKMFHRILPVLELNITNLLPDTARSCGICGKLATLECHQCCMKHDSGRDYTYCESCFSTFTDHKKDRGASADAHKGLKIQYPDEILRRYADDNKEVDCQTVMDLLAVVCIRTSHYVCFLRAEPDHWLFFDSMADREGDFHDNGYNIPEVTRVDGIEAWLDKLRLRQPVEIPHVTRLLEDCYLCFYGNPRVVPI